MFLDSILELFSVKNKIKKLNKIKIRIKNYDMPESHLKCFRHLDIIGVSFRGTEYYRHLTLIFNIWLPWQLKITCNKRSDLL